IHKMAAKHPNPTEKLQLISLSHPAATGPKVWPSANSVVATAKALPQPAAGKLAFTKPVIAEGTINTLEQTKNAENQAIYTPVSNRGSIAPTPKSTIVAAIRMPLRRA